MKTLLKRIYALSITLIMTITVMPILNFNCFAESKWIQVNLHHWEITENGITYITNPKAKEPDVYAKCSEAVVKDVVIPESINGLPVTSVELENNETVQTLKIPATVNWLRILNCPNMVEFNVDENNESFCSVDGVIYDKNCKVLLCYPPSREAKTFKIPDGVENVGYSGYEYDRTIPFDSCKYLENIIFPESLKSICYAFRNCNFEYIELTGNSGLGDGAFVDNKKLKEIVIPENFIGFSDDSFEGCDSLETIVFLRKEPFKDKYWGASAVPIEGDSYWYASLFFPRPYDLTIKTIYVPDDTVENYEYTFEDTGFHNFVPLSEKPKGEIGDVNNNGKIDIMDVVDLQKFFSKKRSSTGLEPDINGDKVVNVFDLIALKRKLINSTVFGLIFDIEILT